MLDEATVRQLLEPFGLNLSTDQIGQLIAYLELLLRWNKKINLTGIRDWESCVTRHFGESLYLGRWVELKRQAIGYRKRGGISRLELEDYLSGLVGDTSRTGRQEAGVPQRGGPSLWNEFR